MDVDKWNLDMFPHELRIEIQKYKWKQITTGKSGAYTYLLYDKEEKNRYLKIIPRKLEMSVEREVEVLKWLEGKLPAPRVLVFTNDSQYQYLLMTEVEGTPSSDPIFRNDVAILVRLLAKGLRMIHSINIKNCPFDQSLSTKIKEAEYRVINGLVDEDDFDPIRKGMKAVDLFQELMATKPKNEDLVFTHGDYTLHNIIINKGDISGFIDWGRAGVADRYQDLALVARSLERKFDSKWIPIFFNEYGIEKIDYSKIEYYKLVDEFF